MVSKGVIVHVLIRPPVLGEACHLFFPEFTSNSDLQTPVVVRLTYTNFITGIYSFCNSAAMKFANNRFSIEG